MPIRFDIDAGFDQGRSTWSGPVATLPRFGSQARMTIRPAWCRCAGFFAELRFKDGYAPKALDGWAARARAWAAGKEPADARSTGSSPKS